MDKRKQGNSLAVFIPKNEIVFVYTVKYAYI